MLLAKVLENIQQFQNSNLTSYENSRSNLWDNPKMTITEKYKNVYLSDIYFICIRDYIMKGTYILNGTFDHLNIILTVMFIQLVLSMKQL